MLAKSLKVGLFVALVVLAATSFSKAGERVSARHEYTGSRSDSTSRSDMHRQTADNRDRFAQDRQRTRHDGQNRQRDVVGGDGLPSVVGGLGTFSGGISAVRLKGNGIYIASDVDITRDPRLPFGAPSVKIITVAEDFADTQFDASNACAYENGICIIRGSN
ncbi:hypothetical protein [Rhizobium sp. FY34]|uniref:hypothetical protein n=1 Tax=Rhizobium sp. FY34 TaxID=2562309 RepID=UPI0010C071AF|nr:hypothetical protein [Rhizobium sp. FY34]